MHKKVFKNPQFEMVDPVQRFQKTISLRILNYYIHSITLAYAWRGREKQRARSETVHCIGERLREYAGCMQRSKMADGDRWQGRPAQPSAMQRAFDDLATFP